MAETKLVTFRRNISLNISHKWFILIMPQYYTLYGIVVATKEPEMCVIGSSAKFKL